MAQPPTAEEKPRNRLDSWKEIAEYLKRDVTTVQRWEKREGMPVHRHVHGRRGSVYALGPELDEWLQGRQIRLQEEGEVPKDGAVTTGENGELQKAAPKARRWFAFGLAVIIVLFFAAYAVSRRGRAGVTVPLKIHSLAVLPLKNLSGDPSQDYLANGMTDALIGRLSSIRNLRVVSYTSASHFKNSQLSAPEIAKTLNVDALVEGSVIRDGNHIRVTAQLIRGATDSHFWSEAYDREFRDVLDLQSDLAQAIAEKVEVTVSGQEHQRLTEVRPVAPEVYETYLKAEYTLNRNYDRDHTEHSIALFQEAIQKDSTFAQAYLGLASAYATLGTIFEGGSPEEARLKVIAAARKALEFDPGLAQAHDLLADALQKNWKWSEAEAEYQRALELNPSDASAYDGYASWLLCQGRTQEALAWSEKGRAIDPLAVSGVDVGWVLFQSRRYADAERELRSVLALRPDDASALWYLGFVLKTENRATEAVPLLEKALSLTKGSPGVMGVLIGAYAHAGRRKDALRLLSEMTRRKKTEYMPAGAFVNAYLGLGENEKAFVWLEQAYKEHSNLLQFLKVHPFFDPLRKDPRFTDLVRRVGLS